MNIQASLEADVRRARSFLGASSRTVLFSGAGLSTSAGIPDFRGQGGILRRQPRLAKTASLEYYTRSAEARRAAWRERVRSPYRRPVPSESHLLVAEAWRRRIIHSVVTQNVDGLHQASGIANVDVVELHGSFHRTICLACGEKRPMEEALARVEAGDLDPHCAACGAILKADTVSFGQTIERDLFEGAVQIARSCEVLLVLGTSLTVYPAAATVSLAAHSHAKVILVNADQTDFDTIAEVAIRAPLERVLGELLLGS